MAEDRMRIVYLSVQGMEEWQGAATHLRAIVRELSRTDEVVVVAPDVARPTGVPARLRDMFALQRRALHHAAEADIVYVRHHPSLTGITWLLRRRGIPVVHEVNGPIEDFAAIYPWLKPGVPLLRALSRAGMRRASATIAVSGRLRSYLIDMGVPADRVTVVHNGADLDLFRPSDDPPGDYVLFVGALTPWQGLETLAAATRNRVWPTHLRLVVVGDGPCRGQLADTDPARVSVLGVVGHERVAEMTAHAVMTVSPKTRDARWSSPLKVYESIASGVPAVVTDVGEQADVIVATGAGMCVPPGDAAALAGAVRTIGGRDLAARRRAVEAARRSREHIGWDVRGRDVRGLLHGIVEETNNGRRVGAAISPGRS